jgi:thymidylate synthase (FAD)
MDTQLIKYTKDAERLLVFSKRTRHMSDISSYREVLDMDEEEIQGNLDYVFNTISSSWEFIDYTFLICDVTRAFTHQLVRHRVGTAFAQQAQRVATQKDFGYLATGSCSENETYHNAMRDIQASYDKLIDIDECRPQDARGILPTNVYTNILFKVNLRALSDMLCVRLCVRAQGEFQLVAREMQSLVISVHPWASRILAPN